MERNKVQLFGSCRKIGMNYVYVYGILYTLYITSDMDSNLGIEVDHVVQEVNLCMFAALRQLMACGEEGQNRGVA